MARAVFLNAELRGKMGGQVYARNKGGAYVRAFVRPINPKTQKQSSVRTLFSSSAKTWNALTDGDRGGWNSFAAMFFSPKKPKAGVEYSGFNAFQSLYNTQQQAIANTRVPTLTAPSGGSLSTATWSPSSVAPTGIFSGQLSGTGGASIVQSLTAATLTSTGRVTATFTTSQNLPASGPSWIDPGSKRHYGIMLFGNIPGQTSPRDVVCLGFSGILGAASGVSNWENTYTIAFNGSDLNLTGRKIWYAVGNKLVITAYAVSLNGESALLGNVSLVTT